MTKGMKTTFVALLIALALASFGCFRPERGNEDKMDTLEEETLSTTDNATGDDPADSLTPTTGEPTAEPIIRQVTPQLPIDVDILFVLDTSGSLEDERAAIATALEQFFEQMKVPEETLSFTAAFTLGWISEAPLAGVYDGSGRLYRVPANPAVLSSRSMTPEEIVNAVTDTLTTPPPADDLADGGEAGLYSLHLLLTKYRQEARDLGFLRPGAALVVIFLSDENDICSLPPEEGAPTTEPDEVEEATRLTYCDALTPRAVLDTATSVVGGAPVQFSGLVYTGPDVPAGWENDIGYGYLEAISLSEGIAVDLASADLSLGVRNLGNTINALAANLPRYFVLHEGPVNPLSIEVLVDGEAVDFQFVPEENAVLLAFAGHPGSTIEINYRVLQE
jgi:hypothetical protein